MLTPVQTLLTILAVTAGAMITRFAPFLLFPEGRRHPAFIDDLGRRLPPAMMGLLVVYCLRETSILAAPHGLPELIALAVITVLHLKWHNVFLSIGMGTVLYMVLVQTVFA